MRSATSCFDSTLYRKTMLRFWPLWALYGVIWLFAIPLNLINRYYDYLRWSDSVAEAQQRLFDQAKILPYFSEFGLILALVGGVLCAMAVFSYLYNNRSACMMHTLPLRREALFTTHYLAGLNFMLLPNLAVALLTAAAELLLLPSHNWGQALSALGVWLLVQSAICLFFFSFASFCAMFTGHILALPAFYGILNALVAIVYYLICVLMEALFYGFYPMSSEPLLVKYLTPTYALAEAIQWNTVFSENVLDATYYLESPGTVAAYAVAGVILAVLALMVYRHRHIESAGDVVSVPVVRPIFRCGVSFCAGLCLGVYTVAFFGWNDTLPLAVCILTWTVVGWFAAEMLLKKSFRVLNAWKGCLVMMAAMALLCAVCMFDWLGIESRVPEVGEVASVTVWGNFDSPYDSGTFRLQDETDPDRIRMVTSIHQAIIQEKGRAEHDSPSYEPGDDYISFRVTYTLTNGSTLVRRYHSVPIYQADRTQEGSVTWQLERAISDRELTEKIYNFDYYETGRLVEAFLINLAVPDNKYYGDLLYLDGAAGQDLERLWQAVRADFDEGTIGVRYLFDNNTRRANTYVTDLTFTFEIPEVHSSGKTEMSTQELSITLTPSARHTLAWLEEMNVLGERYALRPHDLIPQGPDSDLIPEAAYSAKIS